MKLIVMGFIVAFFLALVMNICFTIAYILDSYSGLKPDKNVFVSKRVRDCVDKAVTDLAYSKCKEYKMTIMLFSISRAVLLMFVVMILSMIPR